MLGPRRIAQILAPLAGLLLIGSSLPAADAAERALPEQVTVKDGRSSAPSVDLSKVRLDASWYWDSEQYVRVTAPHGLRPGQRLTVWFDLDGDAEPEGHYELRLGEVKNVKQRYLRKEQEFRLGGGWGRGGQKVSCGGSEGGPPVATDVRRGQRTVGLALDLWSCLRTPSPAGEASGSWRAAVALAKGTEVDMAPNHRTWSPAVAGWGPCDPSGGSCG